MAGVVEGVNPRVSPAAGGELDRVGGPQCVPDCGLQGSLLTEYLRNIEYPAFVKLFTFYG